jgi:hypothetical protein
MKITITIPNKHIRQAILGAHSRYWCSCLTPRVDGSYSVKESGYDAEPAIRFGKAKIARALDLIAANHIPLFARFAAGKNDGPDNDILLQYACFGELKYG